MDFQSELSESELDELLDALRGRLGFCLPRETADELAAHPPEDLAAFVDAIFRAEGLDPDTVDRHLWRAVRNICASAG